MKNDGPEFTPEQVEQQIDVLARFPNAWSDPSSDARLISELYQVYTDDASIASSAWQRLAAHANAVSPRPAAEHSTVQARPPMDARASWQKGPQQIQPTQKRPPHRLQRLLGVCAALVVIVALVAGMAIVLNTIHRQPGPSSPASTATKTPTPVVDEGKVVYHSGNIPSPTHIAWSPDGQRIAEASPTTMQGGPWQLKTWDALTGQQVQIYPIHNLFLYGADAFTSVAWSPGGRSLAVVDDTGRVDIFDAQSGKLIHTFSPALTLNTGSTLPLLASSGVEKSPLISLFPQSGGPISSTPEINWSPDGTYMAESVPGKILIWNATSGSLVTHMADNYPLDLRAFWQPHGNLLAVIACPDTTCVPDLSSHTIAASAVIWDSTTWHQVKQYPGVSTLDWSPDGRQLALVGQDRNSVHIVEALTGQTVKQFVGAQSTAIHWSPDGSRLAEESPTGTITIWSIRDGKLLYTFPRYASEASWSPDGKYIACIQEVKTSSGDASPEIAIWIA